MKNYFTPVLAILILCYLPPAAAQLKIEVIPLQNRTTDQIVPILKPLISEGGTVTGMNNQLIIKTTPANLEEIRQLLQKLDTPPRKLMITVRQDIDGENYRSSTSIGGRYSTGKSTISSSSRRSGNRGAEVYAQDEDGNIIRLSGNNTRTNVSDNNDFQVQTIEGQPAFIQTGNSVPVSSQNAYVTRDGVVVHDTVEYRDVTSGFYVIANINSDNVTLSASPFMSRIHPNQGGIFDIQNIETTVQGKLGEWISLGGVEQGSNRSDEGILYDSRRRKQETRAVLIKVEEIQ